MKTRTKYLLTQYFYNKSSRQELDELFDMVQSAKYNEELAMQIKELYEDLKRQDPSLTYVDSMGRLLNTPAQTEQLATSPSQVRQHRKPKVIYWSVATGAALLLLGFFYGQRQSVKQTNEYVQVIKRAANDENKVILLSDGSKVWINSSSQLEYPQEFRKGKPREVMLTGEAFFEVEHAKNWPFVVHTKDVQTKVLGTKFNIKAYPDMEDILVSVKSGKVMVSKQHKTLAMLSKNEELRIPMIAHAISPIIKEKELKNKIAGNWTAGYLEYEDETISTVIADLERFYGISVQIDRPELADKVITLSVQKDSEPSYILDVLTKLTDTRLKKEQSTYIIF